MNTLLQLNASIFSSSGQSSQLANEFVSAWRANNPEGKVSIRDLAQMPLPHLDAARFTAFISPPATRTAEQQTYAAESEGLIRQIQQADVIVIGLPMYNFGIPSTLKAYFDHIARAGLTFRYTENGPEGLLTGKKAYIFATRGGLYAGTPLDSQTGYIRGFLGFLGIDEVEFVYAEGLNLGEAQKTRALAEAKNKLIELAA